jgi:hypothetical protein
MEVVSGAMHQVPDTAVSGATPVGSLRGQQT